ncbi:MAG TPA: hypothetical protein PKC43_08320 [Phycisphaerales bacterium]|nr:hypothetical protein [Phycisphaerales bacterium]HMP37440.1 hypothetical protein [Phycisphaerales bacterium]
MSQGRLLVSNTGATFLRMAVTFWIGLWTTRVILRALGDDDYGIYTLLGGSIGLVALLQQAFVASAQRHLAHAIGGQDARRVTALFSSSVALFAGVACAVLVAAAALLPLLWAILKVPTERWHAATAAYGLMAIQVAISAFLAPFMAIIAANQRLARLATLQVLLAAATLGGAWIVLRSSGDRLVVLAAVLAAIQLAWAASVAAIAIRSFPEARFRRALCSGRDVIDLASFAGWSFVGTIAWTLRLRGSSLLLGAFFLPSVITGYGIAIQVAGYQLQWTGAAWAAAAPAMATMHGAGRHDRVGDLATKVCLLNGLIVQMLFIPILLETPTLLRLWLGTVPHLAIEFTRLIVAGLLIPPLIGGITMAMQARDRARPVALLSVAAGVVPLVAAALLFALRPGTEPWMLPALTMAVTAMVPPLAVLLFGRETGVNSRRFLSGVLGPWAAVVAVALVASMRAWLFLSESAWRALAVIAIHGCVSAIATWVIAFDDSDRARFVEFLPSPIRRLVGCARPSILSRSRLGDPSP